MTSPTLTDPVAARPAAGRWDRIRRDWSASWRIFVEGRVGPIGLGLIAVFGLLALAHPLLLATAWDPEVYDPVHGFTRAAAFPEPGTIAAALPWSRADTLPRAVSGSRRGHPGGRSDLAAVGAAAANHGRSRRRAVRALATAAKVENTTKLPSVTAPTITSWPSFNICWTCTPSILASAL